MSSTYTQIHIHAVFSVHNRISLISDAWKERLYKYIVAVVQNHGHKLLSIGGTQDHIHLLFGLRPAQSISELMQNVKRDSSEWINKERLVHGVFSWQQGFGAFSYSRSQIPQVIKYIENQEKHHKKYTFIEEYIKILNDFGIEYDEKYIFKPVE